jgi:hypothetical protein
MMNCRAVRHWPGDVEFLKRGYLMMLIKPEKECCLLESKSSAGDQIRD